jgi:hypothetical protein
MPHRIWRPNVSGIRHTLIARWSPWTFEGELVLNTDVIKTWGTELAGPIYTDIDFEIEGHPAFLRHNILGFDLYVDDVKIQHISA